MAEDTSRATADSSLNQVAGQLQSTTLQRVGVLELREEMPVITRESAQTRQLAFQRELRTRHEAVTVEVNRESLMIETHSGGPAVYIGDEVLAPGETREVLLYAEQVLVSKLPYVTEEVQIGKRTVVTQHQEQLALNYEELEVVKSEPPGPLQVHDSDMK